MLGGPEPGQTIGTNVAFVDDDGVLWTVTEHDGRDIPGTRGAQCLIFQSPEAVRRVWQYPSDWRDLVVRRLIALSWRR